MPKGERKEYTKEFKLSAVYLMLSKTMRPTEIAKLLDVDRQTIYRWTDEFKKHGEQAFESNGVVPGAELKRLQKENAELREENEMLKKAQAYFAKKNVKG